MNAEFDYDLSTDQWQALKALRAGATPGRVSSPCAVEQLVALGLAAIGGEGVNITPLGRKVLVRGSSRLWEDVAA